MIWPGSSDEERERDFAMANTVPMIGIEPAELAWIRTLVTLLRHPDPVVPELTRQALQYLEGTASRMATGQMNDVQGGNRG